MRSIHKLNVYVNGVWFLYIHIDNHVFERHGEHITIELILELVKLLNWKKVDPDSVKDGFVYYKSDLRLNKKTYRLIWLIPNDNSFIGVRTAHRRAD